MKSDLKFLTLAVLWILHPQFSTCQAQGTAFTYEGKLNDGGSPANGSYDLQFTIYDAGSGGNIVGDPVTNAPTSVANGLFALTLDFGSGVFTGPARWLELGIRTNGSTGAYITLVPRQELTPAPYAITAENIIGLQIQANSSTGAPNFVGGSPLNTVGSGVIGATIAGGGGTNLTGSPGPNSVSANFGSVGGGNRNIIASGGTGGTIAGGGANTVHADSGTIGGGAYNQVKSTAQSGAIAGGSNNQMQGAYASIGGGQINEADGFAATIPGGAHNFAQGSYSFAAGHNAWASHDGTFVWADNSINAPFASTSSNQFLIRASGGVGIGVADPHALLDVNGAAILRGKDTSQLMFYDPGVYDLRWYGETNALGYSMTLLDATVGRTDWLTINNLGMVGIGTSTPADRLDVFSGNRRIAVNPAVANGTGGVIGFSRPDDAAMAFLIGGSASPTDDFVVYNSGGGGQMRFVNGGLSSGGFAFYQNIDTPSAFSATRPPSASVVIDGAGNLGVGTSSPVYPLDVQAGQAVGRFISTETGANGSVLELGKNNGAGADEVGAVNFTYFGGAQGQIAYSLLNGMTLNSGAQERLRIDVNGHVGIGTTNPTYSLDILGDAHVAYNAYFSGKTYFSGDAFCDGHYWWKSGSSYYALVGDAFGPPGPALWSSSDERLKQGIETITGAVDALKKLRGVTWFWNDLGLKHLMPEVEKKWRSASGKPEDDKKLWEQKREEQRAALSKQQMGFIAQEVERVFPDWVSTDDQGYKRINMERLNAVLVNALKEQQKQIESQEKEIDRLKVGLEHAAQNWESRLADLENAVATLSRVPRPVLAGKEETKGDFAAEQEAAPESHE